MRFFTAAFGENYRQAATALVRTFATNSPGSSLTVFTDLPDLTPTAISCSLDELLDRYPAHYEHRDSSQLSNVFKFRLFATMQEEHPDETAVWLDADSLVFGDLSRHMTDGVINVIAHGRRSGQILDCGDGLMISGDRYAIGGMFGLPPGEALEFMEHVVGQLPVWDDDGGSNRSLADQLILNHLVHRSGWKVNWVSDDKRHIFNLEVGDSLHPVVGDSGLARIRWHGRRPKLDGRPIVLFTWIKNKLDAHIADDFNTFKPHVAKRLRALYRL